MMDKFFGREHEDKPEMSEIKNGMIMSTAAEKKISSSHMALMPGRLFASLTHLRRDLRRDLRRIPRARKLGGLFGGGTCLGCGLARSQRIVHSFC